MPTNHGFDIFYGIPYSNDMRPEGKWDYARNNFPPLPFLSNMDTIGVDIDQSKFIDMFTNRSIRFIKENKDKPFFLYLAHTAPHTPLLVSNIYKGKSKRGLYGDVVEEIDNSVGRLLKTLKDLNIAKNTFVIFTSDNGPWGWAGVDGGSSGLLRGNKGSVYEGGFRVPAIAWMPGSVPQGVTSNVICSALDLLPTFMSIAGGSRQHARIVKIRESMQRFESGTGDWQKIREAYEELNGNGSWELDWELSTSSLLDYGNNMELLEFLPELSSPLN